MLREKSLDDSQKLVQDTWCYIKVRDTDNQYAHYTIPTTQMNPSWREGIAQVPMFAEKITTRFSGESPTYRWHGCGPDVCFPLAAMDRPLMKGLQHLSGGFLARPTTFDLTSRMSHASCP